MYGPHEKSPVIPRELRLSKNKKCHPKPRMAFYYLLNNLTKPSPYPFHPYTFYHPA
jgi:hypothetical protein